MGHQLGSSLMNCFHRCTGQFELTAWLQRNGAAAGDIEKSDNVAVFHDRVPPEQMLHAMEQRFNTARPRIGDRPVPLEGERRLFMLCADPEGLFRLCSSLQPRDELITRMQR